MATHYPSTFNVNPFIWLEDASFQTRNHIALRVNGSVRVENFRAYHLTSGVEWWQCELLRPEADSCCIYSSNLSLSSTMINCEHRVYHGQTIGNTYQLIYDYRGSLDINWNELYVFVYYRTIEDKSYRFFFNKPGALNPLVCSELARSGHMSSVPALAVILSSKELHTINYRMYERNIIHTDPGIPVILKIKAFLRPQHVIRTILYEVNETDHSLIVTTCPETIGRIHRIVKPFEFTERIQLFSGFEKQVYQYTFQFTPKHSHRALVIMTQLESVVHFPILNRLMQAWLIEKDSRNEFSWPYKGHSPGIRVVQIQTVRYSVIQPETTTIEIPVATTEPVKKVQCSRKISTGGFRVTSRLNYDLNSLWMFSIVPLDSGLYRCIDLVSKQRILHDHWIIVLPTSEDIQIAFDMSATQGAGFSEPIVFVDEENFPLIRCDLNVPDSYDSYDGITFHVYHDEADGSELVLNDQVELKNRTRLFQNNRYHIRSLYQPNLCKTDIGRKLKYRLVCEYRYTAQIKINRSDIFPDYRIQATHELYVLSSLQQGPYFIKSSLQSNMADIYNWMLHSPLSSSKYLVDVYVRQKPPSKAENLPKNINVTFETAQWSYPRGWVRVYLYQGERGFRSPINCSVNILKQSPNHFISKSVNFPQSEKLAVYNQINKYQVKCSRLPGVALAGLVLVVFHSAKTKENEIDSITKIFFDKFESITRSYNPHKDSRNNPAQFVTSISVDATAAYVVVPFEQMWNFDVDSQWGRPGSQFIDAWVESDPDDGILSRFIHFGEATWNAVKFHASGSSLRLNEGLYRITLPQLYTKTGGTTDIWTFYQIGRQRIHHDVGHLVKEKISIPPKPLPSELEKQRLLREKKYADVEFVCTIQAKHFAIVFVTFPSKNVMKKWRGLLIGGVKASLIYWLNHPESNSERNVLGHLAGWSESSTWDFRIQRLNIGWQGSINVGETWKMLIHSPWYGEGERVMISCYRFGRNDPIVSYWLGEKYPSEKYWFISHTPATVYDTAWYICNDDKQNLLTNSRILVVLPEEKSSLKYLFSHDFIETYEQFTVLSQKEPSTEELYNLLLGQSGYVYCEPVLQEIWTNYSRLEFKLEARRNQSLVRLSTREVKDHKLLKTVHVYDIQQLDNRERYEVLGAACILHLSADILHRQDIREPRVLTPITKSVIIALLPDSLVTIFSELVLVNHTGLQNATRLTRPNAIDWLTMNMNPTAEVSVGDFEVNITVALVQDSGEVWIHLYTWEEDMTSGIQIFEQTSCDQVHPKDQYVVKDALPTILKQFYSTSEEINNAKLHTAGFLCHIKANHVAISILADSLGDVQGLVREDVRHVIEDWSKLWTPTNQTAPSFKDGSDTIRMKRDLKQTSAVIMRLIVKNQTEIIKRDEEKPPTMYTSDVVIISSIGEDVKVNCG